MATEDATLAAITALTRFGLGPRPGDLESIGADARARLLAEIGDPDVALLEGAKFLDTAAALAAVKAYRMEKKAGRAADAAASKSAAVDAQMDVEAEMAADAPMSDSETMLMGEAAPEAAPGKSKRNKNGKLKRKAALGAAGAAGDLGDPVNYSLRIELPARLARFNDAPIGFAERLVSFWSNHFAIEAQKGALLRGLAGPYEREAIRPHILGSFHDLLVAVTQHPAMLIYLNNATSIGPQSKAGEWRDKGLNENHARELMELHTLGVDGGYTQADVTALANILTGWSVGQNEGAKAPMRKNKRNKRQQADTNDAGAFGHFQFRPQAHEPGAQTLLGESYDQDGIAQGEAALAMLAAHPATAKHIATKLARHFIADDPPAELVALLEKTFVDTGGDLHAVTAALVSSDYAFSAPPTKLRSPQEYLWASYRALGLSGKPGEVMQTLQSLGQPFMAPPSPKGFDDDVKTWLAPDAMTTRLDFGALLAARAEQDDPRRLAEAVLGPRLSANTAETISRAESPAQGMALMLMSPEFQRR